MRGNGAGNVKRLVCFVYAVLAGVMVSIGGAAFLASDSRVLGAAVFIVGLFAVCTLGLNLFTGKICYVFDNSLAYAGDCLLIWLGNLAGTWLSGAALRLTRLDWAEKAEALCQTKLSDTLPSVFILAVFCNILIYLAVENFRENPHETGKYLALMVGVVVFVIAGFEHCVANMFYFTAAGVWSGKALLYIVVMSLGNSVGGVIFPLCKKLKARAEA